MRTTSLVIVAAVLFVLQVSFIPALRPFGVVPSVALAFIALVGLYGTASTALILAVVGGLMLDLVSGATFGLSVGVFVLVALSAGYIHRAGLNSNGPVIAVALVALATIVNAGLVLGGLVGVASSWPVGQLVVRVLIEVALNCLLVLALRPLVRVLLPGGQHEIEVSG